MPEREQNLNYPGQRPGIPGRHDGGVAIRIVAFDDSRLDGAAALLVARHDEHRRHQPLLPSLDHDGARAAIQDEAAQAQPEGLGVAAVDGTRLRGYLLATSQDVAGRPAAWSGVAAQAVDDPIVIDDLYAAAAERWVAAGCKEHYVFVPAGSPSVASWFELSFGSSGALALRNLAPLPTIPPLTHVRIRRSTPDDLPAIARLDSSMAETIRASPSFGGLPAQELEQIESEWADTWERDDLTHFVAELVGSAGAPGGTGAGSHSVVGHVLMYRRSPDLRVPPGSIDLAAAATERAVRGQGVGLAMTAHVIEWARGDGFTALTADWRMSNVGARRFWPARGFEPVFLRLHRSIP